MRLMPKPHFWIYIFFYFKWSGSSKIFDKRDDFDFDMIVNFYFYDDACNKILMLNFINRAIGSKNFEKTCFFVFNFYCRHYELVSKFKVGLKPLSPQGPSEPEFYGYLVQKFKRIDRRADFFKLV